MLRDNQPCWGRGGAAIPEHLHFNRNVRSKAPQATAAMQPLGDDKRADKIPGGPWAMLQRQKNGMDPRRMTKEMYAISPPSQGWSR